MRVLSWFTSRYDKLIAVSVLVLLLASLIVLSGRAGRRPESMPQPPADPPAVKPVDVSAYKDALARLENGRPGPVKAAGLFVPGTRVECSDCKGPIPIETFRERKPCPFCNFVPPPPPKDFDGDLDGMWDSWEREHGFDPTDPKDAQRDADGDGFTNVEEFAYGCDPTSAHITPLNAVLSVATIARRRFKIMFAGVTKSPTGILTFGLNVPGRSYFKKLGEEVEGFEVVAFEPLKEVQTKTVGSVTVDVSVLTLRRDGKDIVLTQGQPYYVHTAILEFALDSTQHKVRVGSTVEVRGKQLQVTDIDGERETVSVQPSEGEPLIIRKKPTA